MENIEQKDLVDEKNKDKRTKMLIALILIVILATFITRFYTKDRPVETSTTSSSTEIFVPESWLAGEDGGFSFKFPESFGTKYISPVDWPIKINLYEQEFSCLEAGEEVLPAGQTKKEMINDKEYCVTRESEGAAGSVYTNYAYALPFEGKTLIMTFSSKATQCMNYDNPGQTECIVERESFDISLLIDQIASTLKNLN